MNCEAYQQLDAFEKRDYIGALVHAVTYDSELYEEGRRIVQKAIAKGLFQNVVINPGIPSTDLLTEKTE